MTLIVRKEGSKPIYISVFCGESIALKQYQHELKAFGYHLKFPSQPLNSAIKESYADIYIIDIAELEQNKAIFQVKNVPFLVYGLLELPKQQSLLDLLYHAAGYFMDEPSLSSIRLNIQLGLQRHRERENYSQRVQDISEKIENNRLTGIATGLLISKTGMSPEDIFEKIKLISRNKQRRVPDVAKEIIRALTETVQEGDSVDLIQPIDDLVAWLDENIVFRKK